MARWSVTLLAVVGIAATVRITAAPVVQLDVWTKEPINIHAIQPDREPLRTALNALPKFRARTLPGSAQAAVDRTGHVLTALSVNQIAPDRMRIRLAVNDATKGHRIISAVQEGYAAKGVEERLRMSSTTSGGFWTGAAQVAGVIAALALICETFAARRRKRRRQRVPTASV